MHRRHALILIASLLTFPALTQENQTDVKELTGAQIDTLLRGNTIIGTWAGTSYTQYFSESGKTVYAPINGRPDEGRWRANPDTNRYESMWRSGDWTPYAIVTTDDGFAWVNGEGLEPFRVMAGD